MLKSSRILLLQFWMLWGRKKEGWKEEKKESIWDMKMKIAVLIDCSPIMFWALDIHSFIQPSQPLRGNGPSSDDETDAQGC